MDDFFSRFIAATAGKAKEAPALPAPPTPPNLTKEAKALARIEDIPHLLEIAAAGYDLADAGTDEGRVALNSAADALSPWCQKRGLPYECAKVFANSLTLEKSKMPGMFPDRQATGREAARRLRAVAAFFGRVIPVAQVEVAEAARKL